METAGEGWAGTRCVWRGASLRRRWLGEVKKKMVRHSKRECHAGVGSVKDTTYVVPD